MNDQESSPWEKWKSFNRQISNDPAKRRKHTIYGFLCALTLIGIYNLLPASLPGCSDSEIKEIAIELMSDSIAEQLKYTKNPSTVSLWQEGANPHLKFVTTEPDYSTENSNYCSAEFHARTLVYENNQPAQLSENPSYYTHIQYSVSLTDDDEIYVLIENSGL